MAMRLDGDAALVHIVPCFSARVETLESGGFFQLPDELLDHIEFPGTGKIQRAPLAFLRQMKALSQQHGLVCLTGPIVSFDVALTNEEALAGTNIFPWFLSNRLAPKLKSMASLGFYRFESRVVLRVTLPFALAEAMQLGILKASQEKTDVNAVGSTPVHTRLDVLYDKVGVTPAPGGTSLAVAAHKAAMHFVACMLSQGRAVATEAVGVVHHHLPDNDPADADVDEPVERAETGMIIENRLSTATDRPLRPTVEVEEKPLEVKEHEIERGIRRPDRLDDADHRPVRVMTENIGPALVECNAPLDHESAHNERLGVARHLAEGTRHNYTDKAKARFYAALEVVKRNIKTEFARKEQFKELSLPAAWSDTLKEATAEAGAFERDYKLSGFVKPGEIGLPTEKRPRLIGNPGPYEAEPQAEIISLFEKMFCHCFPGFMCKGKTLAQTDKTLRTLLEENQRTGRILASCDFSAMDSSWYPFEKQAIRLMVEGVMDDVIDVLAAQAVTADPTDQAAIKWQLKELFVKIGLVDMILFSGERGTSIYNRLLVLTLRTAEITRCRSEVAAQCLWERNRRYTARSEGDVDFGDGDDTVFDARDYKSADEIAAAYKCYGKTIEPVLSNTALEVLSRYAFLSKKGKFYALVKVKKNVERCLFARRSTAVVMDGNVPPVAAAEHAEFATAAYNRAIAAASTPVVRQLALAVGDYQRSRAEAAGVAECKYDADLRRRRPEVLEKYTSLSDLASTAKDAVANAEVNGFVMEHWQHFPFGTKTALPHGKLIESRAEEWMAADSAVAEIVIDEDDMVSPDAFISRCAFTQHIAKALGVTSPMLLTCCSPGAVHPTPARPDRGREGGRNGLAANSGGGGSESERSATARQSADSSSTTRAPARVPAQPKGKGKSSQSGRSNTRRVASPGNTGGVAMVPRL